LNRLCLTIPLRLTDKIKRCYVYPNEKINISNYIPDEFKEILVGLLLGDGCIKMHGNLALLSIQQTDKELIDYLWNICNKYNIVKVEVKSLIRINNVTGKNKKIVYYFQSLTLPYFTAIYREWYIYSKRKNKNIKIIPNELEKYLTPLAIAHWVMGDGTFDKGKNQRIVLCTDCFTLDEVNILSSILLEKYNIISRIKSAIYGKYLIHRITMTGENRRKFHELVTPFIILSLKYRIGL